MEFIYTVDAMARIVGRHRRTVERWIRQHGFPAAKAPDGTYMTTSTLIDQWILSRAELSRHRGKAHSKPIVSDG